MKMKNKIVSTFKMPHLRLKKRLLTFRGSTPDPDSDPVVQC